MMIYISDRNGQIVSTISNSLPDNSFLIDDEMIDDLETGFKTFKCTIVSNGNLKNIAKVGYYVLAHGSLFTILTSTFNTENNTIELYCEDAGLDLINRIAGTVSKGSRTFKEYVTLTLGSGSGWSFDIRIANSSKTLEFTSDDTSLNRLNDILDSYNAEMYFSYDIQGFKWISRTIHFVKKRGSAKNPIHLYLDQEVTSISETYDATNVSNVWKLYGKDNVPLSKLSGYSSATKNYPVKEGTREHSYTVSGNEVICTEVKRNWKSKFDTDGRIRQIVRTNYTTASALISYAVREMEKIVEPVVTYDISFANFPSDIECGDKVRILDDKDDILIEARVLSKTISDTTRRYDATLGEFKQLTGSKAEYTTPNFTMLTISSSNGLIGKNTISTILSIIVSRNGQDIVSKTDLYDTETIKWYVDGSQIDDSDSRISNDGFVFTIANETETHNYSAKLVDGSTSVTESQITIAVVEDGGIDEETLIEINDSIENLSNALDEQAIAQEESATDMDTLKEYVNDVSSIAETSLIANNWAELIMKASGKRELSIADGTLTKESGSALKITDSYISLTSGQSSDAVTIRNNDGTGELKADNSQFSTIKMKASTNKNQGSLAFVSRSDGHVSLKVVE